MAVALPDEGGGGKDYHRIAQRLHVANAHFKAITTLNWPNPTGCSGENNVAGQQRHIGGNKTHQLSAAEDHLTGVGVLPELPVLEELNGLPCGSIFVSIYGPMGVKLSKLLARAHWLSRVGCRDR